MGDGINNWTGLHELRARVAELDAELATVRDHILTDRAHSHCPLRARLTEALTPDCETEEAR